VSNRFLSDELDEVVADPVMDEQIFRFLAAFTQIEEESLRSG